MTDQSEMNELDALLAGVETPISATAVLESLAAEDEGDSGLDANKAKRKPKIDKQAIYDAQDSNVGVADEKTAKRVKAEKPDAKPGKKAAAGATKETKVKATAKPKTPPPTEGSDATIKTRSEAFTKKANPQDLANLGYTGAQVDDMLTAMNEAPKKVGEKAYNLLRFAVGREHLSNYARFGIEQIAKHPGMTVPALVKAMEERGYKAGTARSQAQQISRLFSMFGMIEKTGSTMTLVSDSPLVKATTDRLKIAA